VGAPISAALALVRGDAGRAQRRFAIEVSKGAAAGAPAGAGEAR
jgi:hypothetical protein